MASKTRRIAGYGALLSAISILSVILIGERRKGRLTAGSATVN